MDISPSFALFFCFYTAFAIFAMLNVVTGIFVEHATRSAQQDRDFVIQEELASKRSYAQEIARLFREADTSGDGLVSLKELEEHFGDERVSAYLEALDLDAAST